jgi:hypothetical protein
MNADWRGARPYLIGMALFGVVAGAVAAVAVWTAPEREAVRVYTALIVAANRQDVAAARRLCSGRYLGSHTLAPAPEGGIVNLPRSIHTRFQVWRDGPNVRLCPTNRVGPVYQFVREAGVWKFDGPIGILRGRGEFVPLDDGV